MKIIHLTDFHYNSKQTLNQEVLVKKLCEVLSDIGHIDFIFFTGDLVDKGGDKGRNFTPAGDLLFGGLVSKGIVNKNQIFICCGNHDVNRNVEMPAIKSFVDSIDNIEELNQFVSRDKRQFDSSLENIKNYINYQNNFYKDNLNIEGDIDIIEKIYSIHIRNVDGKQIGVATINTAWRAADSTQDKGKLLFPQIFVDKIIQKIKDCDVKLILMHHPLSDLKDYNYFDLENKIYNHFHFLFSGHVHLDKVETHITGDEGIFCCISPSTLTYGYTEAKVGFTVLDIEDDNIFDAIVTRYTYDKRSENFLKASPISVQVPLNEEKRKQIALKASVRRKLKEETENANELFLSAYENGKVSKSFLELFTAPALRTKSRAEVTSSTDSTSIFPLQDLVSSVDNYVVFGKNKSGKTSILYKIHIDLLSRYSFEKTLSLYVDCREFKSPNKQWDWITTAARYYGISRSKVLEIADKKPFKVLIDNYNSELIDFNQLVSQGVEKKHFTIVVCTEELALSSYNQNSLFDFGYKTLYIHDISRARIRDLVKKWPNINPETKQVALEKIVKVFSQMNIPCNYWTVSLFLWVFEKTNKIAFHNNVELIQLYIEELLDKTNLTLDKTVKIKYDELKEFLGELAYYLLFNHAKTTYSCSYIELIQFTEQYRSKNIRFVIEVEEVVNLIMLRGIIKKTYDGKYTFRLNGVFEYFLAVYINLNSSYKDLILNTSYKYLSFGNELELYAGFNSKDAIFIDKILKKTKSIFDSIEVEYGNASQIDILLQAKIQNSLDISKDIKSLNQEYSEVISSLTPEEQDEYMDELNPISFKSEEVSLKEDVEINALNPLMYEKSLKLLARTFRNSSLDDLALNEKILDTILLYTCHFGISILDSMTLTSKETSQGDSKDSFKLLMEATARFMPLIVQTFLFDALAQDNLERILLLKIDDLKKDGKNQFQLMLIYFLLIDLNPVKSTNLMRDMVDNITIGALRSTILVKMYTYLVFYSHGKPTFDKKIRDLIRDLLVSVDSQTVEKKLQELSRQSLVEGLRNKS